MIRKIVWAAALASTAALWSPAAHAGPTGNVIIGGDPTSLQSGGLPDSPNGFFIGSTSSDITSALGNLKGYFANNDTGGLSSLISLVGGMSPVAAGSSGFARVAVTGDSDPFISFAVSATDTGAPDVFTFVFSIPVSPLLTGLVSVHSTLGVTLTAPPTVGASGESIAPNPSFSNIMLANIDACPAGVDVGTGFSTPASTSLTQSFNATGTVDLGAGGCDPAGNLLVEVSFQGSGNGAGYGLTGLFEVTQVPEPTSIAIIGAGLLGLFGVRRRRGALSN